MISVILTVACSMIPDRLDRVFQKLLISFDFYIQPSIEFLQKCETNRKARSEDNTTDTKALLVEDLKGEWP